MAKYVTLYQFTDQGIRNVKDSPARLKAGIQRAESLGMKVLGAYYTQGQYDLVVISEAADEKVATAFALAQSGQGNTRSITLRAFDPTEFEAIVKLMP
ncbi:MAG: GYD domain-containing protein [Vicinamibacterales bacterium]